jgi:hypothetical protein
VASESDTLADLIKAAFMLGVASESKKVATKAGRTTVKKTVAATKKGTRKVSAYSKRYGKAFKKVAKKYKKKGGGWVKDGFVKAQRAAHKEAKR